MAKDLIKAVHYCYSKGIKTDCTNLTNIVLSADRQPILVDVEEYPIRTKEEMSMQRLMLTNLVWELVGKDLATREFITQTIEFSNPQKV